MKGKDKGLSGDIWSDLPRGAMPLDSLSTLKVSGDGMVCTLHLNSDTPAPQLNQLLELLIERGISFGIDKSQLVKVTREGAWQNEIIIASGTPAKKGRPAEVMRCYRTPDEFNTDNRRDIAPDFQYVKKNELLAVKLRSTKGIAGKDVYGLPVEPESGDEVDFIAGKNVQQRFFPDKIEYSALCDGLVKTGPNRVDIESLFVVDRDVDEETGAVDFPGNILVKGDVLVGGSVTCRGNLTVEGNVNGGTVDAGVFLEVKGRVENDAIAMSSGKMIVRKAVNASLTAREDLEIIDMAQDCKIKSGGSIKVKNPSGYLAGGEIISRNGLDTPFLGSPKARETRITISIDDEVDHTDLATQAIRRIDEEMVRLNDQIRNLRANPLDRFGKSNTWKLKSLEKRLFRLNQQRHEYEKRMHQDSSHRKGWTPRILVRKRLYPLIKLKNDRNQFILDHSLDCVEIFPSNETGEWQVTSLDGTR